MGTPVVTTKCRDTRLSEAQAASGFLLAGLLWCAGCRKQLQPLVLASGERSYDCRNGCRMHRLNATAVEGRAVDAARTSLLARTERLPLDPPRLAIRRAFVRIVIGGSDTDLRFEPEITNQRQDVVPEHASPVRDDQPRPSNAAAVQQPKTRPQNDVKTEV